MKEMNVTAVLDYGQVLSRKKIVLSSILAGISVFLCVFVSVGVSITIYFGIVEWSNNAIVGVVTVNIFCGFLAIVIICVLIRDNRLKKKISVWKKGAVLINATVVYSSLFDYNSLNRFSINFEYMEKRYSILSEKNHFTEYKNKWLSKYINQKLTILYSFKYNVVMAVETSEEAV